MADRTIVESRPRGAAPASPRGRRIPRASWLDTRLLAGVVLLLGSVVVGARVFADASHTTLVWAAATNLSPGEPLTAGELTATRVGLGSARDLYLSAARLPPAGYVVTRRVGAHELVPFAALAPAGRAGNDRVVALPVSVGHFDPDLAAGAQVDVYATARSAAGASGPTKLVSRAVTVVSRSGGQAGFSGSTVTVTVSVPEAEVSALVQAVQGGGLDLVDVPAGGR